MMKCDIEFVEGMFCVMKVMEHFLAFRSIPEAFGKCVRGCERFVLCTGDCEICLASRNFLELPEAS